MALADLQLPTRLLAGGGPSTPDPIVLRALATPLIGQFDPEFTAIMDDVAQLARETFLTANRRCFAVSGLSGAGVEAVINTLVRDGDRVAVGGGPGFVANTADTVRRYGAEAVSLDEIDAGTRLVVVPLVDPASGTIVRVRELAAAVHARGARVLVDATLALGACEVLVDEWGIDACVAGVDYALGAPPGMALVTYSSAVEAAFADRRAPPPTSYLDLIQLQAYWSPDRLNHHTAPTSLVYGLREALRLIQAEGLDARWQRHRQIGETLRGGLVAMGLEVTGDLPFSIVQLPTTVDEAAARAQLLERFAVYVTRVGPHAWRLGLLGAEARLDAANRVLSAVENVLGR